ncbi:MAG: D-alanine--D-alanine ligase [Planctomycetes bacterium]|nr:D-alanine--D-alanine ligase [Planctomycetota bacterium]
MAPPLVLMLHNYPTLPLDHPDAASEHSVVEIAQTLGRILEEDAGFRTTSLGLKQDPTYLWAELKRRKPAVVFNLFEGNPDNPETEAYVAGLLQWKGIPFTGSPLRTLALARAKHLTKQLLRGAGLPTAEFFVVSELPVMNCPLEWPVIVKPAQQDASVGLAQDSVCTNQEQLESRVQFVLDNYGVPVLVEEFIAGREFNVALVELPELRALPPSEVIFPTDRPGYWPILTYECKWKPGTADYDATPPKYPADITPRLADRLCAIATEAYRLIGCRDYARVDFRVRPNGKPSILEVNPNPEISDDAGFAGSLSSAGLSYREFIVRLVEHALTKTHAPASLFTAPRAESLAPARS